MCTLHYFNPEHDDSLAVNHFNHIPDKASLQLKKDLSFLLAWIADKGDLIWIHTNEDLITWKNNLEIHPLFPKVQFVKPPFTTPYINIEPWGWDKACVSIFQKQGFATLPTPLQLEFIRQNSSRVKALELLTLLRSELPFTIGKMLFCETLEEVRKAVEVPFITLLKMPWSGSGRGLRRGFNLLKPPLTGWVSNVLKKQGGIMVEPFYNKVKDFAMEFLVEKDSAHYLGLSVFETSGVGGYSANLVASEDKLLKELTPFIDPLHLKQTQAKLIKYLPQVLGCKYTGIVGIDMMLVEENGKILLHPCVELNCRKTMGYLALKLNRLIPKDKMGKFHIIYAHTPQKLHQQILPLLTLQTKIEETKLHAGYLPLTPILPSSCFHACLTI